MSGCGSLGTAYAAGPGPERGCPERGMPAGTLVGLLANALVGIADKGPGQNTHDKGIGVRHTLEKVLRRSGQGEIEIGEFTAQEQCVKQGAKGKQIGSGIGFGWIQ